MNKYKNLFNKINISNDKIKEIKAMPLDANSPRGSFKATFASALAILAGVFVISNGITYAATGDSLVKKVSDSIRNYEADESLDKHKIDEYIDTQGNTHYKYDVDGNDIEAVVNESVLDENNMKIKFTNDKNDDAYSIEIGSAESEYDTTSE